MFFAFFVVACSDGANNTSQSAAPIPEPSILKEFIEHGKIDSTNRDSIASLEQPYRTLLSTYADAETNDITLNTIYITETGAGSVDADGMSTDDGSSWENALAGTSLKETIDNVPTTGEYFILLGAGTYTPTATFSLKNNVTILGGWEDTGGWVRNTSNLTKLSGANTRIVIVNTGILSSAQLAGVSITDGSSTGNGGGMSNSSNSSPTLTQVTFSNNAANNGAGMHNDNSSPTLIQVTFSNNTTTNSGAGMYNNRNSSPTLNQVTFSNNSTITFGGGMYNNKSSPSLTQVTFSGNSTIGIISKGGGMYNASDSLPRLTQVTFSNNSATTSGGGMYNQLSSPALTQVTFSNNSAPNGGGLYNNKSSPSLTQVTFSGNTATTSGGGIYHNGNSARLTMTNSILWNNTIGTANTNQPIYVAIDGNTSNDEVMTIAYSVLQGYPNVGMTGYGTSIVTDGNTLSGATAATFTFTGHHNLNTNPNLGTLALHTNNGGGFVQTMPITAASSAYNIGVYIKRTGSTFYYSTDNSTWFNGIGTTTLANTGAAPTSAQITAATYFTGTTAGEPDAGAFEVQ